MNKLCFLSILLLAINFSYAQKKGKVKIDTIVSFALSKNVTNENTKRPYSIYLPPSYSSSNKRYPVLYLLNGTGDSHMNFTSDSSKYKTIQALMDKGIASGRIGEMIIVMPNENTIWGGSFYVNSSSTGNWEDFTTKELTSFIDAKYRTINKVSARAIAGHSMGGYGAFLLAMKHPSVFSVTYSLNGGFLSFDAELNPENPAIKNFINANNIQELLATKNMISIGMLAASQAFSPNPTKPPFYADKPYLIKNGLFIPNPVAYDKWTNSNVITLIEKYKENLLKLKAIKFDCSNKEDFKLLEINNNLLSQKLTTLNIPHFYESYNGDHRNNLWGLQGRIYNDLLPFIFDNVEK
jgi:S-formylglutathione hydrolase FrmB